MCLDSFASLPCKTSGDSWLNKSSSQTFTSACCVDSGLHIQGTSPDIYGPCILPFLTCTLLYCSGFKIARRPSKAPAASVETTTRRGTAVALGMPGSVLHCTALAS